MIRLFAKLSTSRIYFQVACGHPALEQLKSLGASWDPTEKAWWVNAAQRHQVEAILAAHGDESPEEGSYL